jgi:hypothetical protein
MSAIVHNPQAPKRSMAGIVNAANQEPGAAADQLQFEKQRLSQRNHELESQRQGEGSAAGLMQGSLWKEIRSRLNNAPGMLNQINEGITKAQSLLSESLPKIIDIFDRETREQDAGRIRDRREMQSEFNRKRAESGKSQILNQVRSAYTNLTGANTQAVRKMFDRLAG